MEFFHAGPYTGVLIGKFGLLIPCYNQLMTWITDPEMWLALATLTSLEVVLGVDNIVFISILVGKLPSDQQPRARLVGLALAMIMRILLLFSLSWVMKLTAPMFHLWSHAISGRDLIL